MLSAGETQYGYDANGNRITKSGAEGLTQYQYNYDNLLSELIDEKGRSTIYTYDAFMRRTAKEAIKRKDDDDGDDDDDRSKGKETRFLYDGLHVLQEISGPQQQHIAAYTRANGRIISRQAHNADGDKDPDGRRLYYAYDGLGSVAGLTNHRGKVKTRYRYDAFGEVVEGSLKYNPYAFTGKRLDTESGLYHFHFRQYDPEAGVWTTPDPISIWGGMNLYRYVQNNPVNHIDPLGLVVVGGPQIQSLLRVRLAMAVNPVTIRAIETLLLGLDELTTALRYTSFVAIFAWMVDKLMDGFTEDDISIPDTYTDFGHYTDDLDVPDDPIGYNDDYGEPDDGLNDPDADDADEAEDPDGSQGDPGEDGEDGEGEEGEE